MTEQVLGSCRRTPLDAGAFVRLLNVGFAFFEPAAWFGPLFTQNVVFSSMMTVMKVSGDIDVLLA
jgi:hypothetical protein